MNAANTDSRSLVAILPGDGIGPEVTDQAERVLLQAADQFGLEVETRRAAIGGDAIDRFGDPLPEETLTLCHEADAVFLGAVGGPRWSGPEATARPEDGLLGLRTALGVYANIRPIRPYSKLTGSSPVRAELLEGVDLVFVRELTGGLYFGRSERLDDMAYDTCVYTVAEIERVARVAGAMARTRRGRVTSVDKANVLETSRLWRATTTRVMQEEFPEVELEHRYVDATAMQIISEPTSFDVIVTENLFGDILSDEAAVLCGSLGMLPSASLGATTRGLYEPVHGSAPDIAGHGKANPYAAILCMAMLLRHSLGSEDAAAAVEAAVARAIDDEALPVDVAYEGVTPWSTEAVAGAVLARLDG